MNKNRTRLYNHTKQNIFEQKQLQTMQTGHSTNTHLPNLLLTDIYLLKGKTYTSRKKLDESIQE